MLQLQKRQIQSSFFMVAAWCLLKEINDFVFNNKMPSVQAPFPVAAWADPALLVLIYVGEGGGSVLGRDSDDELMPPGQGRLRPRACQAVDPRWGPAVLFVDPHRAERRASSSAIEITVNA